MRQQSTELARDFGKAANTVQEQQSHRDLEPDSNKFSRIMGAGGAVILASLAIAALSDDIECSEDRQKIHVIAGDTAAELLRTNVEAAGNDFVDLRGVEYAVERPIDGVTRQLGQTPNIMPGDVVVMPESCK